MLGAEVRETPYHKATMTVGATALLSGDLVKLVAGLVVPVAADDVNIQLYVATHDAAISADVTVDVSQNFLKEIAYTGATPAIGAGFGVDGPRTLDQTDTTNLLLTVLEVDTVRVVALVTPYSLTD